VEVEKVKSGGEESEEVAKLDHIKQDLKQVEHASPHAHFNMSPEPEPEHQDTKDVARSSPNRRALKERTQSMEMTEIIEALHQEDELQEAWEERDQTI
jgi:hypothetical protein